MYGAVVVIRGSEYNAALPETRGNTSVVNEVFTNSRKGKLPKKFPKLNDVVHYLDPLPDMPSIKIEQHSLTVMRALVPILLSM